MGTVSGLLLLWYLATFFGASQANSSLTREYLLEGGTDKRYNGHVITRVYLKGGYDAMGLCVQSCLDCTSGPACVAVNLSDLGECRLLAPLLHPNSITFTESIGWRSMAVTSNCPHRLFIPGSNHCYWIEDRLNGTFLECLGFCNHKLVAIESASEHLFLTHSLQFYGLQNRGFWTWGLYVGYYAWKVFPPGVFVPMTFTAWAEGQPSSPRGGHVKVRDGAWYDAGITERHYFICEEE